MSISRAFNFPSEPPDARLRFAIQRGDIERARELIKEGADVNAADNQGFTPLIIAARHGRTDCARLLLGHNADMNKADNSDNTALIWASFYGKEEIALMLIKEGADVNARGRRGTALTCATFIGQKKIVAALLKKNANAEVPDHAGNTPGKLARKKGYRAISGMLNDVFLRNTQYNFRESARRTRPRPKFKP